MTANGTISRRLADPDQRTPVVVARDLGKRYGRRWALTDCTMTIPRGKVVGLVGPNGAGKTTLLHLAVGLLAPTSGTITVLGGHPGDGPAQLARVGFIAQDAPVYPTLRVKDHLRLGARLNPHWDATLAGHRVERLDLDRHQRAGELSGGQRAQLALTLAMAKRPELLVLDEPVASLDPLARREFLNDLADVAAGHEVSVVLSSHLVADLERVCDYLIILAASRVQVAGDIASLLRTHYRVAVPGGNADRPPARLRVIDASETNGRSTFIVYSQSPPGLPCGVGWRVEPVNLADLVFAYMTRAAHTDAGRARTSAARP